MVKLQLGGRAATVLKTDKKGRWAIVGLVAGSWAADIEAEGYVVCEDLDARSPVNRPGFRPSR